MSPAKETLSLVVPQSGSGARLDHFLAERVPELSRTKLQRLVREGGVRLNGRGTRPGARVNSGDQVTVMLSPQEGTDTRPAPSISLDILHVDESVVVINKAAGMVVHPALGHAQDTLVNALSARFPELIARFGGERPGLVHRLDRDTSGVMVVAMTEDAGAALRSQFKARTIKKVYVALVKGTPNPPRGIIDAPIGRDPVRRKRMAAVAGGRPAQTAYRTMGTSQGYGWLEVIPTTGRTHQIRVHLAAVGHPVAGDPVYGRRDPLIARTALHALRLELDHPATGDRVSFSAPLPGDLRRALEKLGLETG